MNTRTRRSRIEIPVNRRVLVALRKSRFPNASDAARAFGISPGALHDIENGRRNGRRHTLERIARELDVDFELITQPDQTEHSEAV